MACKAVVVMSWPLAGEQSLTYSVRCCKHSPVATIRFYLPRDGRRHICDTKATILLKSLRTLELAKILFFSLVQLFPYKQQLLWLKLLSLKQMSKQEHQEECPSQVMITSPSVAYGNKALFYPRNVCNFYSKLGWVFFLWFSDLTI